MALEKELSMDLRLPAIPQTTDQKLYTELQPIHNAIRMLAYTLDAYTGATSAPYYVWNELEAGTLRLQNITKVYLPAFEDMAAGRFIAIYDDAGTAKARLALDPTYRCRGYVTSDVVASEFAEIVLLGAYPEMAAGTLTPGATYYLSSVTPGATTTTSGTQALGFAVTDKTLFVNPSL